MSLEENHFSAECSDETTSLNAGQHLDYSLVRDPEAKTCLVSGPTQTVS